jgi:predicted glycoside hydrolase/deacetylase ChbG (UPF0249 family)
MRLLIVNADDFGLSRGLNEGIVEAHAHGIVTSASLMVSRPGAGQAAKLAGAHPSLSVGLHFDDGCGADLDDPAQVAAAFADQLAQFRELLGTEPTHVDAHHHSQTSGARLSIFRELTGPLGVPLRHDGRVHHIGGFYAQTEIGVTNLERVSRASLRRLVDSEAGDGLSELSCHPGRILGDFSSSYVEAREVELRTLTEPGLAAELEASGVRLVSFHAWAEFRAR